MKIIKYNLCTLINVGTDEEPVYENSLSPVEMGWSEANEAIAAAEAYNGEYTIEDDGVDPEPTDAERIAELEAAQANSVTWDELAVALKEGVNSV